MTALFRVLYCSRNLVPGNAEALAAHVRSILEVSRRNNARDGITGGLLFSADCFAQVLEGPSDAVERTFERIQCDERHSDVTVLDSGPINTRDFPAWSMAFSGAASASPLASSAFGAAFQGQSDAGNTILALMRSVVQQEDEQNDPPPTIHASSSPASAHATEVRAY